MDAHKTYRQTLSVITKCLDTNTYWRKILTQKSEEYRDSRAADSVATRLINFSKKSKLSLFVVELIE